MKKRWYFLIIVTVFFVFSCAVLDSVSDVSVSAILPDKINIFNNASVSTLRTVEGKIIRSGVSVYHFHFNVAIPAGYNETIIVSDFEIQEEDKIIVTDANFTWSM